MVWFTLKTNFYSWNYFIFAILPLSLNSFFIFYQKIVTFFSTTWLKIWHFHFNLETHTNSSYIPLHTLLRYFPELLLWSKKTNYLLKVNLLQPSFASIRFCFNPALEFRRKAMSCKKRLTCHKNPSKSFWLWRESGLTVFVSDLSFMIRIIKQRAQ